MNKVNTACCCCKYYVNYVCIKDDYCAGSVPYDTTVSISDNIIMLKGESE